VPLADQSLVDTGEFLTAVVDPRLSNLAVGKVDRPAIECRGSFAGSQLLCREHLRMPNDVYHDGVAVVVGVHRVKDIAGFHVEPAHIGVVAFARHDPDPGRIPGVPRVREPAIGTIGPRLSGRDRVGDANPSDQGRQHESRR
jgi:hypothetical protein